MHRNDGRVLEHVARAIWAAQREDSFPKPGTIERALIEQMARAAIRALADEVLGKADSE